VSGVSTSGAASGVSTSGAASGVSTSGAATKAAGLGSPKAGVLPVTGGSMLLIYGGVLVASGAGLVLLRRSGHDKYSGDQIRTR
jgi:LPXTG-motif cell wall-anchored protein